MYEHELLSEFAKRKPGHKFHFAFVYIGVDVTIETLFINGERIESAWSPPLEQIRDPAYVKKIKDLCIAEIFS